jgi:putative DNA primase/helicase
MDAALGRWPELLQALAGLSAEQLSDRHQPCPACGGTDRYRWDRDDGPGGWFCNRCGGKDHQGGAGSGVDLLMRVRGWSLQDANRAVLQHLGIERPIPPPPVAGAEAWWQITPTVVVRRMPGTGGRDKDIRPLTWNGSRWELKAPAKPRPLYWPRRRAGLRVLVVEGEKTADAAARLFPAMAVCSWMGGCKAVHLADWQALAGQDVVLWPDADDVGRQAMAKLAGLLLKLGATVAVVVVPDGLPDGWDLADADWDQDRAAQELERCARAVQPPQTAETAPVEPEQVELPERPVEHPDAASPESWPFTCLGYDDAGVRYYQPHRDGQVVALGRAAHTSTNLIALTGLPWWESMWPSKAGVNWTAAGSRLFEVQSAVGMFDPSVLRGRGAWIEPGGPVLHLGDRLLRDGRVEPLTHRHGQRHHYQRSTALLGPGDADSLDDEQAAMVWLMAERFNWDSPAMAVLLAGWVALAPFCGLLPWRPHIWLTASAASGKSTLLNRFVGTLLGDLCLVPFGSSTEAGIRQTLRSDALPVILDEAESNERNDQSRIQAILQLARVASTESRGGTYRGSPAGEATVFRVRSMFLLASISTALKQGADRRRFAQLTMRNPAHLPEPERIAHWKALDADLERHITPEFAQALLARTVRLLPVLLESVRVFRRVAAEELGSQALADQYGTLLAGAWQLRSSAVPTTDEARALLQAHDWAPFQQDVDLPDEQRCLQRILQAQLRVDGERGQTTRTVLELLELVTKGVDRPGEVAVAVATAALGRHGLKAGTGVVLVANASEGLRGLLEGTPWAVCYPQTLGRLDGASKAAQSHFRGMGTSRATALPMELLGL